MWGDTYPRAECSRSRLYHSRAYRTALTQQRMIASMNRNSDCWDNAVAESFFAMLEWELLAEEAYARRAMATRAFVPFIKQWYHSVRLHSSLGYVSPQTIEQDLTRRRRAALTRCQRNRVNFIEP